LIPTPAELGPAAPQFNVGPIVSTPVAVTPMAICRPSSTKATRVSVT